MKSTIARPVLCLGLICLSASALPNQEIDGKAIYKYCKACHGARGEGGENGKYPRLAGLPQPYLERQLQDFKNRKRLNKPMIPIFKHVRFDAAVIEKVAGYLAGMTTPDLSLWPYRIPEQALTGFGSKGALVEAGAKRYSTDCAACHGDRGQGGARHEAPPLVDQYPAYLNKQVSDFATGNRVHEYSGACGSPSPDLRDAVINHLVELGK